MRQKDYPVPSAGVAALIGRVKNAGIEVSEDLSMFRGQKRVRFTATEPGEYEFYCHVDSHAKKGMKGTFVVVP